MTTTKNKFRIAIIGGPRTGKTTLAHKLADGAFIPIRHTDDLIEMGWSEASAYAAKWFDEDGPWVIEGVAVGRALRKWLNANVSHVFPGKDAYKPSVETRVKPCDKLIVLTEPHMALGRGQETMAKGVFAVLDEIVPELISIGVEIEWDNT